MQFAANFDSSSIDSMQFPIVPSTYSLLPLAASRMSAAKIQADASTCLPPAAVLTIWGHYQIGSCLRRFLIIGSLHESQIEVVRDEGRKGNAGVLIAADGKLVWAQITGKLAWAQTAGKLAWAQTDGKSVWALISRRLVWFQTAKS